MGDHSTVGLTWADLQHSPDDRLRRELLDGELHVTPSPVTRHQQVAGRVLYELMTWAEPRGALALGAPLDVVFDERNVVEPDVLVVLVEHLDRIVDGYPRAAPDLAVEVSSPTTKRVDRIRKREVYERFAVAEYWIVDLDEERLEAYVLTDGRYGSPTIFGPGDTVTSSVLPGFAAPFDRLVPAPLV